MNGLKLAELESRLRQRLSGALPGPAAQRRFAPLPPRKGWQPDDQPATARTAAALILLYPGDEGVTFPLTMRRQDLPHHPGQISLPGGRVDPGESPEAAALREAREEIGVDPAAVRLIGALSPLWVIVSNFVVRPFVGISDVRPIFRADPREVEALIEAPVAWVRDPSRVGWGDRIRDGVRVEFPYYDFAGHRVWGATAMILSELGEILDG